MVTLIAALVALWGVLEICIGGLLVLFAVILWFASIAGRIVR